MLAVITRSARFFRSTCEVISAPSLEIGFMAGFEKVSSLFVDAIYCRRLL
jgi:hypothetical protein